MNNFTLLQESAARWRLADVQSIVRTWGETPSSARWPSHSSCAWGHARAVSGPSFRGPVVTQEHAHHPRKTRCPSDYKVLIIRQNVHKPKCGTYKARRLATPTRRPATVNVPMDRLAGCPRAVPTHTHDFFGNRPLV